jgi:hypothetical protein
MVHFVNTDPVRTPGIIVITLKIPFPRKPESIHPTSWIPCSRKYPCSKGNDIICCKAWGRIGPGGLRGLQLRWGALSVSGGFDTHPLPPVPKGTKNTEHDNLIGTK